jgi:hypothetical protein
MIGGVGVTHDIVTVVVPRPPALSAEIVYVVTGEVDSGVPEMTPVVGLNDKPGGRDGPITQLVEAPPVLAGVNVVIADPTV